MKKIALVLLVSFMSCNNKDKIAYIDIQAVFEGFQYKKDLEKEFNAIKSNRKFLLDSMETSLKLLSGRIKDGEKDAKVIEDFKSGREVYLTRKSQFEEEEQAMLRSFDEKIIKQINSYVRDYGKVHEYDVIYGANSTGNIMYGDSSLDITTEVTKYINEKFSGK